ncbi:conserved membrane hypothetical protein [uncultured Eubacteriales bacterium]|uniref:Isoprenylcysteine carboxylmethyltransferase family protein n=1 Tax=uncultured Eubacteriales bacterium TaxID=172733 RepID=A0A212KH86_9FIRM|nr:conserved membrane hypothetical protein [uncultured Eubacteriales bacterium]
MFMKLFSFLLLAAFYAVYLGKMLAQRKKNIKTDQMARGNKARSVRNTELVMKLATYSVVCAEVLSIAFGLPLLRLPARVLGVVLALTGDIIFAVSVHTMRDSWRAGISTDDQTAIVTTGIYRYSRNPAFLGFDLLYCGVLLVFFNWPLLILSLFAAVMLHLQILQEEKFLPEAFGEEYIRYKNRVNRYLGRR